MKVGIDMNTIYDFVNKFIALYFHKKRNEQRIYRKIKRKMENRIHNKQRLKYMLIKIQFEH